MIRDTNGSNGAARLIVLLDDKPYGLEQIRRALPHDVAESVEIRHIDRWSTWQADPPEAYILLLDYFLDKDGVEGADIVDQITTATHLIGFSSVLRGSEAIRRRAEQCGDQFLSAHALLKQMDGERNEELEHLLIELLATPADA